MRSPLMLSSALAAFVLSGAAGAQDFDEDVITVTATKREQTLQEVPVAVTVIDDEVIENAQINDVIDLQSVVPSLRVSQLQQSGNITFSIRGFGNGANNTGIEPSVGVFVDGVYRSRAAAAIADFPDLARVEVLRGPQSTLFGKNASVGVISFVTREPSFVPTGFLETTFGNYDQRIVKGLYSGPLTDTMAFSVSGAMNKRDGYVDNLGGGDDINDRDRYLLRGQFLWEPSDEAQVRVIADYDYLDELCCYAPYLSIGDTGPALRALGATLYDEPFEYRTALDEAPVNTVENIGISIHGDLDLGFAELTTITSYREQNLFQDGDVDFSNAELLKSNALDNGIQTTTAEVRLANATENFSWLVGGFLFYETIDTRRNIIQDFDLRDYVDLLVQAGSPVTLPVVERILGAPAGSFFNAGGGSQSVFTQDNLSGSLFAQGDYDVTDRLTGTLGVAYTYDKKEVTGRNQLEEPFYFAELPALLNDLRPLQFLSPFVDFPNAVEDGERSDDKVTYTAKLAYDVQPNLNVYGSYATGFKASSFNLTADSSFFPEDQAELAARGLIPVNRAAGTRFAGPEEVQVFEGGLKYNFGRGYLNFTVFDQKVEDFQSVLFIGTGFVLDNAGEQSTTGIEFDTQITPFLDVPIAFTVAGTYLDAEYDSFEGATVTPGGAIDLADGVEDGLGDLSGQRPAGVPEFSLYTAVQYDHDFASGASGFVRMDYQYDTEVQVVENVSPEIASREVSTINAAAGITFDNEAEIRFFGRNLNNDEYLQSAFPTTTQPGSFSGYPNAPRTYGVTFKKSF